MVFNCPVLVLVLRTPSLVCSLPAVSPLAPKDLPQKLVFLVKSRRVSEGRRGAGFQGIARGPIPT